MEFSSLLKDCYFVFGGCGYVQSIFTLSLAQFKVSIGMKQIKVLFNGKITF